MAKTLRLFVTGDKKLDAKLKTFELRLQKKWTRQASRVAIKKIVQPEFKRLVPKASKAMANSTVIRSVRRSRVRIGSWLILDRERLRTKYVAAYGKEPNPLRGQDQWFFYPAAWEFGVPGKIAALKPMRKAIYDHKRAVVAIYRGHIAKAVYEARRGT